MFTDSCKAVPRATLYIVTNVFFPSKVNCSSKTFVNNTPLQLFTGLHYFGEFTAIGSIWYTKLLIRYWLKRVGLKIPNCMLLQFVFYHKFMISYILTECMIIVLRYTFFHRKIRLRPKKALKRYAFYWRFYNIHIFLVT